MVELIRSIEPGLLKKLVDMEISNFGTAAGLNEWTLVPLIRHGRVFVIWHEDQLAGLCEYMLDWDKPGKAYLVGLSVSRQFRNRGYAVALMTESMSLLAREKIEELELTVSPDNQTALTLYAKLGFRITTMRENEYGPFQHRLVMSRPLHIIS